MKTLIFDTETSHMVAAVFSLYPESIGHENILQDWFMICAGWRWLGENKTYKVSLLDDPERFHKDPTDDYHVVKTLCDVIGEADMVVAHNGKKFDMKKLKARAFLLGLPPLAPVPVFDTLEVLRREFALSSNRLDSICKQLGYEGKKSTSKGMWLRVLQGNRAAIREMVSYMDRDVTELEKLFLKVRPYSNSRVANANLFNGTTHCCPQCGSGKVHKRGIARSGLQTYQRYQCKCGKWSQGEIIKAVNKIVLR